MRLRVYIKKYIKSLKSKASFSLIQLNHMQIYRKIICFKYNEKDHVTVLFQNLKWQQTYDEISESIRKVYFSLLTQNFYKKNKLNLIIGDHFMYCNNFIIYFSTI